MRLKIAHSTSYTYATPVPYALQRLRLEPKSSMGQNVIHWDMALEGGIREAEYEDQHHNRVILVSVPKGTTEVRITCTGEVDTADNPAIPGQVGAHRPHMPLWAYLRPTPLTEPGRGVKAVIAAIGNAHAGDIAQMHRLSAEILGRVTYETGRTDAKTTAEQAIDAGHGVCQDHAHIFIAAARALGHPARYVSGYLYMDDRTQQDASHAWAEVWLDGLDWVGFDISNGISPDNRYVRVASGFDYRDAAPITGMTFGPLDETMLVTLHVEQ